MKKNLISLLFFAIICVGMLGQTTFAADEAGDCEHEPYVKLVGSEPRCDITGWTDLIVCRKCGVVLQARTAIPAPGHDYVYYPEIPPTLFENGRTEGVMCTRCSYKQSGLQITTALSQRAFVIFNDLYSVPQSETITIPAKGGIARTIPILADGTYTFSMSGTPDVYLQVSPGYEEECLVDTICRDGKVFVTVPLKKGMVCYIGIRNVEPQAQDKDYVLTIDRLEGQIMQNPFRDVNPNAWYYDYVVQANKCGLMTGTSPDTFNPSGKVTRGMFATILYRIDNDYSEYHRYFNDVPPGLYYSIPITWAYRNRIVTGYQNGLFGPNNPITREQIATILYRFSTFYKETTGPVDILKFLSYRDVDKVSDFAVDGMLWAVSRGVITGTGDGRLNPQGYASRAEIAAMVTRYLGYK